MNRSGRWVVLSALLASAAACSSEPTGPNTPADTGVRTDTGTPPGDTGTPTDTGTPMDTGVAQDTGTPPGDTGTPPGDTGAPRDTGVDAGPPYDPCASASVVDLNARGTLTGTTVRYTGNNNSVGAMAPLRASCGGSTGHQVAFRYVPRTSTRLRVSTNNAGTEAMFDTVVWAASACGPSTGDAGPASLGCNDDSGGDPRRLASSFTSEPVTMGTAIYIVVAGYTPPLTGNRAQGTFELTVTELATVAVGGACDATGATNICATGSTCVTAGTASTCVADGASGGRCRTASGAMPCDTGLTCSLSVCRPSIAAGGACGGTIVGVCATGTSCVGATGSQRCVADGASGGHCRTGGMCDTGLTCSGTTTSGYCGATIAAGGACGGTIGGACATGTSCVGATGSQRCVADGAAGGRCRTGGMCDTGLTCSGTTSGTCYRNVAAGGACDLNDPSQRCATNTTCAPSGTAATCQAAGTAAGTLCAMTGTRCASGLTCDGPMDIDSAVCRRAGTAGGACDLVYNSVACPTGQACLATSATAATCTATRPETEPNNTPAMPQAAITASTAFSGTLVADGGDAGAADAQDCYAVTVPANGGITVETAAPGDPGCDNNDTTVTIYNASGSSVTSNDDGPRRHYCSFVTARMLSAGTYAVCVRTLSDRATYTVSIGVFGP